MSAAEQGPDRVVRDMCAAWATRDAAAIAAHFAEDAIYHTIPMDPIVGADAIEQFIAAFVAAPEHIEFEIRHQVANGPVVFNERIDRFVKDGRTVDLPVAGVFEVADGKITAWRDYFDPRHAAGLV